MLLVIPPIFILLGLLDVWVPREKMMRFMGPSSGMKGGVLAFLLGSFAAGPLYGAFPVAAVLDEEGREFYEYPHLHRRVVDHEASDAPF